MDSVASFSKLELETVKNADNGGGPQVGLPFGM